MIWTRDTREMAEICYELAHRGAKFEAVWIDGKWRIEVLGT